MDPTRPTRPTAGTYAVQLPAWARRRETARHLLVHGWVALLTLATVCALFTPRMLPAPVVLVTIAATVAAYGAARRRWWRWRRRRAGHPVVRGKLPSSVAFDRSEPSEPSDPSVALLTGAVHVTTAGWSWRPMRLCPEAVGERCWPHPDVVGLRFVPSWGPGLPRSGYVRLLLADAPPVDLLVWDPAVLGLFA